MRAFYIKICVDPPSPNPPSQAVEGAGEREKINPIILERKLNKINDVKISIIFRLEDKLNAAVLADERVNKPRLVREIASNPDCLSITTISVWSKFPLTLGGKIDKKSIFHSIVNAEVSILNLTNMQKELRNHSCK